MATPAASSALRPFATGTDHSTRNVVGYGPDPPNPQWPGGAVIALSFVINYEEGGENNALFNHPLDTNSELFLTEGGAPFTSSCTPTPASRNLAVESTFDFGSHRGFWRLLDLFKRKGAKFTCWAVGRAVELNPQVVDAMEETGSEVASHSWRWIDYSKVDEAREREEVKLTVEAIRKASKKGSHPKGWYTGRQSLVTRRAVYEIYREMGILDDLYDNDAYDEDLPYYIESPSPSPNLPSPPLLIIPYTLECNDMKFGVAPGFSTSDHFFHYLRDAFDVLYAEGERGAPKMMSIGLHCRLAGRPGRFMGLEKFVDHVLAKEKGKVWIATREEIAQHWRKTHPPRLEA